MDKVLSWTTLLLLLCLPVSAQSPLSLVDGQVTPTLDSQPRALGELALTPVGENSVVIVLDRQQTLEDETGFADLVVFLRTSSYVADLPTVRDFGVLSIQGDEVAVTFPRQQLHYYFSLQDGKEAPDGVTLIHSLTLETWAPGAGNELTLDEALTLEQDRHAAIRSISSGLFQKDDGTSDGGCAQSKSITCHDGSSASATCPDGCAGCECAPARCACSSN